MKRHYQLQSSTEQARSVPWQCRSRKALGCNSLLTQVFSIEPTFGSSYAQRIAVVFLLVKPGLLRLWLIFRCLFHNVCLLLVTVQRVCFLSSFKNTLISAPKLESKYDRFLSTVRYCIFEKALDCIKLLHVTQVFFIELTLLRI